MTALAALPLFAATNLGVETVPFVSGLRFPVALTHAPGDSERIFVTEQEGRIRIVRDGALVGQPFLDISDRVRCCGERGLLSVAFHPLYQANGRFFVNYTDLSGNTVVSAFKVLPGQPDSAAVVSEAILMVISQPFSNHNGGQLQFGPDGYLYVGTGDGGSAGDPGDRAQNLLEKLGKILRIDVDQGTPYGIPPDNPYVFQDNAQPEIWASGLRNPWRFSFDRRTGDLFIGDVGQNRIEEVNFQPSSSHGGENYGWRFMEGTDCYNPSSGCERPGLVLPILEYPHSEGCSVTGGYVYRGSSRRLQGIYFYGDYCAGTIWGAVRRGDGTWENVLEIDTSQQISAFGEDSSGELYVVSLQGQVLRLRDAMPTRRRPARP